MHFFYCLLRYRIRIFYAISAHKNLYFIISFRRPCGMQGMSPKNVKVKGQGYIYSGRFHQKTLDERIGETKKKYETREEMRKKGKKEEGKGQKRREY